MKKMAKLGLFVVGVMLLAYAGTYAVNSARGGYWTQPEHLITTRAIHLDNVVRWQPLHGYQSPKRSDAVGKFYAPLIWLDRHLVHRTHLITLDGANSWLTDMPESRVHPDCRTNLWWKEKGSANQSVDYYGSPAADGG